MNFVSGVLALHIPELKGTIMFTYSPFRTMLKVTFN